METTAEDLRVKLTVSRLKQIDVAAELGITEPQLSRILSGRRPLPENFAVDMQAAMERIGERMLAQVRAAINAPSVSVPAEEETVAA